MLNKVRCTWLEKRLSTVVFIFFLNIPRNPKIIMSSETSFNSSSSKSSQMVLDKLYLSG